MRMMLKAVMPVEKGNQAIKDGSLPRLIETVMKELEPESAYFYAENGKRSCQMVFDMKDTSQIPVVAERFFMDLNAELSITPVMTAEDLKKGLDAAMAAKSRA